tara:strand:+ start:291 stop:689 length:399 start_codon:yes stop_codon:yes gene_type:complete
MAKYTPGGPVFNEKQTRAQLWPLDPMVGSTEGDIAGGASAGAGTVLSTTATISFCTTATSKQHVKLGDGLVTGQIKLIVHKTRSNSKDLIITPDNFAGGYTQVTSNAAGAVGIFVWDGSNWHVTENAGMVPT